PRPDQRAYELFVASTEVARMLAEVGLTPDEQEILERVNAARRAAGAGDLVPRRKLFKAARDHAGNIARYGQALRQLDGKGPEDRLSDQEYAFSNWAENLSVGRQLSRQAVDYWLKSAGHRINVLDRSFTEVGIGLGVGDDGKLYHDLLLAAPAR